MRSIAFTADKRLINALLRVVITREDRQLLISGGVAMISFLMLGILLARLAIMQSPERETLVLNLTAQDGEDSPLVWQLPQAVTEEAPPESQIALLSQALAETPGRGDFPSPENALARLLTIDAAPTGGVGGANRDAGSGILDPYNPSAVGLARQGMYRGRKLLAWTNEPHVINKIFPTDHALWRQIRSVGFDVRLRTGRFQPDDLQGISQIWIFAGHRSGMDQDACDAVVKFVKAGGGLYLCGDNRPYFAESEQLCWALFRCKPKGNYLGQQLLGVLGETGGKRILQGPEGEIPIPADNWQRFHPLLTGVQCIYEGSTVSQLPAAGKLTPVLRASNGRILAAVSNNHWRVVVDGGFTRYFPKNYRGGTERGAGTSLWATNVAVYLEGDPSAPAVLPLSDQ